MPSFRNTLHHLRSVVVGQFTSNSTGTAQPTAQIRRPASNAFADTYDAAALVQRLNPVVNAPEEIRLDGALFAKNDNGQPVYLTDIHGQPIQCVVEGQPFVINGSFVLVRVNPPKGVGATEALSVGMTCFAVANEVREQSEQFIGRPINWAGDEKLEMHPFSKEAEWTSLNAWSNLTSDHKKPEPTVGFDYLSVDSQDRFIGPGQMHLGMFARDSEVVAHEVGHQIVTAEVYRRLGGESDQLSTTYSAAHEAIADVISFLHALGRTSVVRQVARETQGDLHQINCVSQMGELFDYLASEALYEFTCNDRCAALLDFGIPSVRQQVIKCIYENLKLNASLSDLPSDVQERLETGALEAIELAFEKFASTQESTKSAADETARWTAMGRALVEPAQVHALWEILTSTLMPLVESTSAKETANRLFRLLCPIPDQPDTVLTSAFDNTGAHLLLQNQDNRARVHEFVTGYVRSLHLRDYDERNIKTSSPRRYHEVTKYDISVVECHDASQCWSSAAYQVLADLVSERTKNGETFEAAVEAARQSLGRVVLGSIENIADPARMTAADFAQAILTSVKKQAPETFGLWHAAFAARGIPIVEASASM